MVFNNSINKYYTVQINRLQSIKGIQIPIEADMSMAINSSLLYILTLKKQLRRFAITWILILPFQTFFLFTLSIQSNLGSNSSDFIAVTFIKIRDSLISTFVSKACSYLGFIISILLICCFAIYLILKKPNNQLDKHGPWLNKLILFSVILVYVFELIIVQLIWNLKTLIFDALQGINTSNNIYWSLIWLASILFIGILNHRIRIFGFFILLQIFSIYDSETFNIVSSMVGIFLAIYLIKRDEEHDFLLLKGHNFRKILHSMLAIFYVWKLVQHFLGEINKNINLTINYIYLCFMVITVVVLGFFLFTYKVNRRPSPVIQLCECLINLQHNSTDTESKMLSIQIVNEYFKHLNKKKQIDENLFELKTKKQKDWTKQDWYYLVNLMIKQQYQKQPSLQSGIKMLKCRLMIKDKKIFQIIQLLKDLAYMQKNQDISNKYEVLKITLKTNEIYFKKYQTGGHSISLIIREVDKLNQNFYQKCCATVSLLYQFWINVVNYKIKIDEEAQEKILATPFTFQNQKTETSIKYQNNMEKAVIQINKQIRKLQELLRQIKSISNGKRQNKALNCIKFLATYTQNNEEEVSLAQKNLQIEKSDSFSSKLESKTDFSQYFQVINSKITKISLKLATELGYRKLQAVGEHVQFLMPKSYRSDIEMLISNHDEPFLKVAYLIPLICSDNSILLKNIDIHIELDCLCGYRTVYQTRNHLMNKDPILIYNIQRNVIQFYNKAFIIAYKVDKAKLDSKIRSQLVNPDQFFKDLQLSDKSIQAKLTQSGLESQYNCRINLQQLSQKRSSKLENVRLSLIEREKKYMILKVMKGYRIKSMVGDISTTKKITNKSIFSSFGYIKIDSSLPISITKKMKDNNLTFCKIENPYENKVNTKKIQLSRQSKITLKNLMILLPSLSILLLLVEGLIFLQINLKINTAVNQQSNQALNMLNLYTSLMLAFQSHYKYQLLLKNQDKIQNLGINFKELINKTSQQIEYHVNKFQQNYLNSLKSETHGDLKYSIEFKYFTYLTDTTTTNLFDFSQNLLLYGNQDSLNFLIANHPHFVSLSQKAFNTFSIIQDKLSNKINIQYIASVIVLGMTCIFLVISTLINSKISKICDDIKLIFKLMKRENINSIFASLNNVTKKFLQLGQINASLQSKYKYALNSCLNSQQKQGESVAYPKLDNQKQTESMQDKLVSYEEKQLLNTDKTLKNIGKPKKKIRYWLIWGYLLIMIALGCLKLLQIFYFADRVKMEYQIINFQIQNKLICSHLIRRVLQTQYTLLISNVQNYTNPQVKLSLGDAWLVNNKRLPDYYFDEFSQLYFQKVYKDLCTALNNKSQISFNISQCQKVGHNLFANGLPISIQQIYQTLINSHEQYSQYWFHRQVNHSYAIYQEIFMGQQLVIAVGKEVQIELDKYISSFHQKMNYRVYQIFVLSCIFGLGLIIMIFKIKSEIYRMSQIGIGYFLIIPKKILLEEQVLNHIRKNLLLNRIDII